MRKVNNQTPSTNIQIKNNKQLPSTNIQINSKIHWLLFGICNLVIGVYLEFVIWSLLISIKVFYEA